MAEQTQPVQREVALKVIKAAMDSRQVIARLEAEQQPLIPMASSSTKRCWRCKKKASAYRRVRRVARPTCRAGLTEHVGADQLRLREPEREFVRDDQTWRADVIWPWNQPPELRSLSANALLDPTRSSA
jgi:hypothetical protein